jgi:hypothetical protein
MTDKLTVVCDFHTADEGIVLVRTGPDGPSDHLKVRLPEPKEMPEDRRQVTPEEAAKAGARLWETLPREVTADLSKRLAEAKQGSPLQLVLCLRAAQARDLPWELLAGPEGPLAVRENCRLWREVPSQVPARP